LPPLLKKGTSQRKTTLGEPRSLTGPTEGEKVTSVSTQKELATKTFRLMNQICLNRMVQRCSETKERKVPPPLKSIEERKREMVLWKIRHRIRGQKVYGKKNLRDTWEYDCFLRIDQTKMPASCQRNPIRQRKKSGDRFWGRST